MRGRVKARPAARPRRRIACNMTTLVCNTPYPTPLPTHTYTRARTDAHTNTGIEVLKVELLNTMQLLTTKQYVVLVNLSRGARASCLSVFVQTQYAFYCYNKTGPLEIERQSEGCCCGLCLLAYLLDRSHPPLGR